MMGVRGKALGPQRLQALLEDLHDLLAREHLVPALQDERAVGDPLDHGLGDAELPKAHHDPELEVT